MIFFRILWRKKSGFPHHWSYNAAQRGVLWQTMCTGRTFSGLTMTQGNSEKNCPLHVTCRGWGENCTVQNVQKYAIRPFWDPQRKLFMCLHVPLEYIMTPTVRITTYSPPKDHKKLQNHRCMTLGPLFLFQVTTKQTLCLPFGQAPTATLGQTVV